MKTILQNSHYTLYISGPYQNPVWNFRLHSLKKMSTQWGQGKVTGKAPKDLRLWTQTRGGWRVEVFNAQCSAWTVGWWADQQLSPGDQWTWWITEALCRGVSLASSKRTPEVLVAHPPANLSRMEKCAFHSLQSPVISIHSKSPTYKASRCSFQRCEHTFKCLIT